MDVLGEKPDLIPVLLDQRRMVARVPLGEFGRVVDLRVVLDAVLDLADAQRLVAVVAAVFEVGAVFDLLRGGEVEDLLAQAELPVDLLLSQAEVGDVEEAWIVRLGCGSAVVFCWSVWPGALLTYSVHGVEELSCQFLLPARLVELA